MKVRICGASGSGKTYLAEQLTKTTHISVYRLDEIVYDFSTTHKYDVKREAYKRDLLLNSILRNKEWILEGGWYSLTRDFFDQADIIIFLKVPFCKRLRNTLKRYNQRKKEGKDEGKENFLSLTFYNIRSLKKWHKRHDEFKKTYKEKFHSFRSADKAFEWWQKNK